ncbi:hypothetical protein [Kitasatospora sp. NPDC085879]|uniref:hypothetical protein n=1 Tax=Kitasatospora sp. NPDC085879 TaxID=3154769 RepID=UPI00342BEEFA
MNASDEAAVPEAALAKITELGELAARAARAWHGGDLQGAFGAVNEAMPVAAAAAAALNVLLEVDRARAGRDEPGEGNEASAWWG